MEITTKVLKNGNRVESAVFQGVVYSRYIDSDDVGHQQYFVLVNKKLKGIYPSKLHRAIYESVHGKIPAKYHVHHKDKNPLNNDISNLECVNPTDHNKKHDADRTWRVRGKTFPLICMQCKQEYLSYNPAGHRNNFCSKDCSKLFNRLLKRHYIWKDCVICETKFLASPYQNQKTCSKSCGTALGHRTRAILQI